MGLCRSEDDDGDEYETNALAVFNSLCQEMKEPLHRLCNADKLAEILEIYLEDEMFCNPLPWKRISEHFTAPQKGL